MSTHLASALTAVAIFLLMSELRQIAAVVATIALFVLSKSL